jgi:hypothetical protein
MSQNKKITDYLQTRKLTVWLLAISGLIAYNWWVFIAFKPTLMSSFNELYSDLEVVGHPYAVELQNADVASGILILCVFLLIGSNRLVSSFKEWLALIVFAIGGMMGGFFPESCSDTTNAACRRMEWALRLPLHNYLHMFFGIMEFGAITLVLIFAHHRTKHDKTLSAKIYTGLYRGAFVAYPLLGLSYLTNRLGGLAEIGFFVPFTIILVMQISERLAKLGKN